jgi:hypothetical protein
MTNLLTTSTKIEKSNHSGKGYVSQVQYLSPASESGYQLCPFRSPGCESTCLGHSSGRMVMLPARQARIRRTLELMTDRTSYGAKLNREIAKLAKKAAKLDMVPVVRLNGTSDIRWEDLRFHGKTIFEIWPDVQFYDYTKWTAKLRPTKFKNYHLTYSRSELTTIKEIQTELEAGRNVAVVFDKVPTEWRGWKVINGDEDDLRHLDPVGVIVGLKAKGAARKDHGGFVVRLIAKLTGDK